MILVEEKKVIRSVKKTNNKIYINTLVPDFNYTDESGRTVKPQKCCINL